MLAASEEELTERRQTYLTNPRDFGVDERKVEVDFSHLQLIEDPIAGELGRFADVDKPVAEQPWYTDVVDNPVNKDKIVK